MLLGKIHAFSTLASLVFYPSGNGADGASYGFQPCLWSDPSR